ncbi:uncharacterized protein LOC127051252 [Gopherus flavomarginatus]|uniref:uncharacterized protein LOC127051252 n=1 Tax=Gopherus flavomarginatus TaxID=286002 RepID=UPI0021CBEDA6|nr:uncharacterized protein LOC127051252 [Gopherus flavomarginatus]
MDRTKTNHNYAGFAGFYCVVPARAAGTEAQSPPPSSSRLSHSLPCSQWGEGQLSQPAGVRSWEDRRSVLPHLSEFPYISALPRDLLLSSRPDISVTVSGDPDGTLLARTSDSGWLWQTRSGATGVLSPSSSLHRGPWGSCSDKSAPDIKKRLQQLEEAEGKSLEELDRPPVTSKPTSPAVCCSDPGFRGLDPACGPDPTLATQTEGC